MDPLKEAFSRIKEDMFLLSQELNTLKTEISDMKEQIFALNTPTNQSQNPTEDEHITSSPTLTPTLPQEIEGSRNQYLDVSTGNRGVPTDTPTNQQTHQQTNKSSQFSSESKKNKGFDNFQELEDILNTLDSVKKGIRLKFKRLTSQEMSVFSTIYTLEEQGIDEISHKTIASHLNLSESSVRDYINRLISKGIPVQKTRKNNKKMAISVSKELKKITNLSTILKLREI